MYLFNYLLFHLLKPIYLLLFYVSSCLRLYCCHVQGVCPGEIILHGRSLGTAPALQLARRAYDELHWELGGIVLQCPFVSIRQVAADYVGLAGP